MTTLDDLARVERETRGQAAINARFEDDYQAHCKTQWADTIAAFIAAQRERDADNAKLRAELAQVAGYLETITAAKVELAADLGKAEAELAAAKAEVEQSDAEYQDAVTLAKSNLDRFQAAQAACGQMREALAGCMEFVSLWKDHDDDALRAYKAANRTLSTDAGRNYVDASGAVESVVENVSEREDGHMMVLVPRDWQAGKPVLIVPKPEGWK